MKRIKLAIFTCLRCGYDIKLRNPKEPRQCPRCYKRPGTTGVRKHSEEQRKYWRISQQKHRDKTSEK